MRGAGIAGCRRAGASVYFRPVSSLSDDASPAWSRRLREEFGAADRRATALAAALSPRQLNWQPRPGAWSIGQCLEHLHVANEVYLPPIARALVGARAAEVEEISPGWFGRWFIRSHIDPDTQGAPRRAPRKIVPHRDVDPDILSRLLAGNQKVRDLVQRAAECDVNRVRFRNPFVPVIWFTVGTGFEILARHQRRHLLQAERVRSAPGFPPA